MCSFFSFPSSSLPFSHSLPLDHSKKYSRGSRCISLLHGRSPSSIWSHIWTAKIRMLSLICSLVSFERPTNLVILFFFKPCFDFYTNCFDFTVTPSDDTLFLFPPPASAQVDSDETYEDLQVHIYFLFLFFHFTSLLNSFTIGILSKCWFGHQTRKPIVNGGCFPSRNP